MKRTSVLALLVTLVTYTPSEASDGVYYSARWPIQPAGYGLICNAPPAQSVLRGQDTVDGEVLQRFGTAPSYDHRTLWVPAQRGVGFGVYFYTDRAHDGSALQAVMTHPPMGKDRRTRQSWMVSTRPGSATAAGYTLEDREELVPGPWTLTLYDGATEVWSVTFRVVSPALTTLCD